MRIICCSNFIWTNPRGRTVLTTHGWNCILMEGTKAEMFANEAGTIEVPIRRKLYLIQIWNSWVSLCDGSHSKNMKSLLQECASCHPFRVTKDSPVFSHRSSLPLKQSRTTTNVFLRGGRASQDESEGIQRVLRGGKWNRWRLFFQLTPVSHLHLRLRVSSLRASAAEEGAGVKRCYLVVMITGQGEYETRKTE